jgi:hypothetical protein
MKSHEMALAHWHNHQTHHRGQIHALLTGLVGTAPELDLLFFQRLWANRRPEITKTSPPVHMMAAQGLCAGGVNAAKLCIPAPGFR